MMTDKSEIKSLIKERMKKLKTYVPAAFLAMKKAETPWYAKAMAAVTVAYALSPIDLIPDFIPILGYLDDLLILPALVALTVKCVPDEVWKKCCDESADMWKNGKPKKWYYAVPIVIFWLIIVFLIIKAIWL